MIHSLWAKAPEAVEVFEKYGVFSERELPSRYEVRPEQYALTIAVEAKLALELGTTVILPAAIRYQTELAQNVATMKATGVASDWSLLEAVSTPIGDLMRALATPRAALTAHAGDGAIGEAAHTQSVLLLATDAVRTAADTLWKRWWQMTSGCCRPIRRCSTSCDFD